MASHPKVLHWDDERDLGHGHIITTAYGWAFWPHADERVAEHVRSFATVREAKARLRELRPCACLRCTSKGKKA